MYKDSKRFGNINFRNIRYQESRMVDKHHNYKLGFDIVLLPSIRISNDRMRYLVEIRFLAWEFLWFRYKSVRYTYDIQGRIHEEVHGVRYLLSLKWLFKR